MPALTFGREKLKGTSASQSSNSNSSSGGSQSNGQRSRDQHLGFRFWVQIDSVEVATFAECTGLSVETETFEYAEGGLNTYTHRLPVRTKYGNITLRRGLDPGQDLYRWFMATLDGKTKRRNVSIKIYGPVGDSPVYQWDLQGAYPVKWTGPDLKTEAGAVAVETLEFAFDTVVTSG